MKLFSRSSAEGPGRRRGLTGRLALSVGLLLPLAASFGAFAAAFNASPASASIPLPEVGGTLYQPVVPTRIADTRANSGYQGAGGTLTAGRILQVQVTGIGSVSAGDLVPLGAFAVVVNITAVNPTASGYLTAYAAGQTLPLASTVNFIAGQTIANEATITLGNAGILNPGYIDIYNYQGSTDVVVDVQGYYSQGEGFGPDGGSFYYPISYLSPVTGALDNAPVRVLDTRPGSGQQDAGQTVGPDSQITFFPGTSTIAFGLIPFNATAVVLNLTEATETASSYLTAWATGFGQPLASNLNWPAGAGPIANRVIVPYNPLTQTVSVFNWTGSTDVVADLDGYFAPESEFGLGNFEPTGCPIHGTQSITLAAPISPTDTFTLTVDTLSGPVTTAPINTDTATGATVAAALEAIGYPVTSASGGPLGAGTAITINEGGFPISSLNDATTGAPVLSSPSTAFESTLAGTCPGFFAGSDYYGLTAPNRIADTRPQTSVPYALSTLGALSILDIAVNADSSGPFTGAYAPAAFDGVDVNVTVTDTTAASYLEIFPAEQGFGLTATQLDAHPASDINWVPGEIISNGDLVAEVADTPMTSIDVFNWAGTVDVVVDVYGYFALDPILPDLAG